MGNYYDKYVGNPEGMPTMDAVPKFPPLYGFQNGRKAREMIATEAEMDSACLPLAKRDYCAHVLLRLLSCKAEMWPWTVRCHHQKEEYNKCQYDDYVLRMKEFEREKRLLHRQQRIERAAA